MRDWRPWYEVLGVAPDATAPEVRDAYLALVKEWHPDRYATTPHLAAEAEERVKVINSAYDEARYAPYVPAYGDPEVGVADWPEWFEGEPSGVRLMFEPGGLVVRAVALVLALVFAFFAVLQTVNALDLLRR